MGTRQHASILIVGGGIIGCSTAYHLAKAGVSDVVVLEKSGITHGATWHAAGLVGQLRSSRNTTRMLQRSVALYDRLEAETGQSIDWKQVGSLRLACSSDRLKETKRLFTMARSFGLEMEIIGPAEAKRLFPLMSGKDLIAAAFVPGDGYVDPASLAQAIAKAARRKGVRFLVPARVEAVKTRLRRVVEVELADGDSWTCDTFVNCAGMWSRALGRLSGVAIPALALEHQYLVTEPITDMPQGMPTLRDPDRLVYYKPEVRGLAVGGYEPQTLPFGEAGIPRDFAQQLLPGNLERFEMLAVKAAEVTPILNEVGVRQLINGPIPYSADGDFVMGRVPELDNYFVASGFLYGIAAGGGAGEMMAEWILEGAPSLDLWPLDVRRFQAHHNTRFFLYRRSVEHYGGHYLLHYPGEEKASARGLRLSPLYWLLKERGAVYGSRAGWERPNWFAPPGVEPRDRNAYDRRETNWFQAVAEEHRSVRERVALIDQTSFAKLEVVGGGALAALQGLAAADLDRPDGSIVYTQLLNEKGGIEADVTIVRLAPDRFYIVTGSAFGTHDFNWIGRHLPSDGSVNAREVTSAYAVINLVGPKARAVLERVAEADVSNAAFPFGQAREIEIGAASVLALRVGYVGELGWELHVPTEFAAHLYGLLREAGESEGIADVGYRAIDSLRMEKGYLYWSADITPDYTPFEAGLGARVALKRKGDFLGRAALEREKAEGSKRRLAIFSAGPEAPLWGGETILSGGKVASLVTSANYGHSVGRTLAYGYLPRELLTERDFEIEAFGERYPARREEGPLYDPRNLRLKA